MPILHQAGPQARNRRTAQLHQRRCLFFLLPYGRPSIAAGRKGTGQCSGRRRRERAAERVPGRLLLEGGLGVEREGKGAIARRMGARTWLGRPDAAACEDGGRRRRDGGTREDRRAQRTGSERSGVCLGSTEAVGWE